MVSLWCSMQKLETSRNSINALRMEGPQIKAEYVPGKIREDPCLFFVLQIQRLQTDCEGNNFM